MRKIRSSFILVLAVALLSSCSGLNKMKKNAGQVNYSASKAGLVGMTLPMARELSRFGIRVMTIAPGIFWTPMVDGMPDHIQESLSASIPFPSRLGRPEEFAELAGNILESTYMNGTTIRLDGAVRLAAK